MLITKFVPRSRSLLAKCFRLITNSNPKSTQATSSEQRFEYYKNLNAQHADSAAVFPEWDKAQPFEAIPGPKPLPILGNLWRMMPIFGEFYGKDFKEIAQTLHERYGDIFILKGLMGIPSMLHVFDPRDIETVYRNEGPWPIHRALPTVLYHRKVLRNDLFQGITGVFNSHGEEWYKIRSTVNPILMKPKNVLLYVEKMDLVAAELVDNISYLASTNENGELPENFMDELYKWSLESVGLVTLDRRLGCLDRNLDPNSKPAKLIKLNTEIIGLLYTLNFMPSLWKIISTPTWKRYVEVMDFITNTCLAYINEVKIKLEASANEVGEEGSMLEQMLVRDPQMGVVTAIDMLGGGLDTTGKTLGSALYYLAKNPEKQSYLRKEAMDLLPSKNSPVTPEVLNKSPYVKAVIREVTRIAPVTLGVQRTTVKDIVLGGYQIPKGTYVITNNLIISNQDKYFTRAKEFIPERWLRSTTGELSFRNGNQFISLPFGFGPRSCVGKRIANLELETVLLKIIRNFELSWPHDDMVFKTELLHGIAAPLKLRISPVEMSDD